jgi:hypothetical protein
MVTVFLNIQFKLNIYTIGASQFSHLSFQLHVTWYLWRHGMHKAAAHTNSHIGYVGKDNVSLISSRPTNRD